MGLRVDVDRLRPVLTELVRVHDAVYAKGLAALDRSCGFSWLETLGEVVVTAKGRNVAVAARLHEPPERALECLKSPQLADAWRAFCGLDLSDVQFRMESGLLVGRRGEGDLGESPDVSRRLAIAEGAAVAGFDDREEAHLALEVNPREVVLDATWRSGIAKDEMAELATFVSMARALPTFPSRLADAGISPVAVTDALSRLRFESDDGTHAHVRAAFGADPPTQAAGFVGAVYLLERAKTLVKLEEPRRTLKRIAQKLTDIVEREVSLARRRFPPSAPRVPASLAFIHGVKYQSAAADWTGSWKTLRFRIADPQYFAYSFESTPDGRHVIVRAEGDLDGNGKTSLFELEGKVQSGAVDFADAIRETNTEE